MFLNSMKDDEKERFLELAYKMARIDGNYAEEEDEIISSYKAELGIDNIGDTGSIDELIDFFANRNESVKKIVFFEIYGMICADNKIEKSEEKIFEKIKIKFAISKEIVNQIIQVADELQSVYDKLYDILE